MLDLTKCQNRDCPFKWQCKRHTVKDSLLQAYAYFLYDDKNNTCDYFLDNGKED